MPLRCCEYRFWHRHQFRRWLEQDDVINRIKRLKEMEADALNRAVYKGNAPAGFPADAGGYEARLSQMENDLRMRSWR